MSTADEAAIPSSTHAVTDDALADYDTVDLVAALRRREVSSGEVWEAARARAQSMQPSLNAASSWPERGTGTPSGDGRRTTSPGDSSETDAESLLAGVPTVLKDNEDLVGLPTGHGSRAVSEAPSTRTSRFASQLRGLGMDFVAKTTLPEFGLTATTESVACGDTRNPWNTAHSVGGSSGGSAALVAAGAVPIGHANDGGGSIRIPASSCGLVGLKPTRGRLVHIEGTDAAPINMAVQGVLTRTVRDTALFYSTIEQHYPSGEFPPIGDVTSPTTQRLRIGVVTAGPRGLEPDARTAELVRRTGELCESLGHHVEEIPVPYDDQFATDFLRFWGLLGLGLHRMGAQIYGEGFRRERLEEFTLGLSHYATSILPRIPGSVRRLQRYAAEYDSVPEGLDLVLSPVLGHEPPPIGLLGPEVPFREHMVRLLRFASYTAAQNISGAPAISLPAGFGPNGVPMGVHFVASMGQERMLLELALQIEEARPWPTTPAQPLR